MVDLAKKALAKFRRQGKGVWHITLVADGYDEVPTLLYPGGMSKNFAAALARREYARTLDEKLKFVHVAEIVKKDRP